ncbi:B3 domain-containing transcription repressor VAL1-like isoform X2 [Prosopis cineraria]|uniref:B3 domain-containing transcription repressor VAL1-like isoform X2 n=1 Tax=Prosopis cineraria TaxID=364024 RepID=UPI00240FD8D8|nr:B3 domain-containing transcription repressor VAL1-like isoform X2 [Prosopis cineraria]
MGSEVCVGVSGGSATAHEWKKGWPLPSGGFAQFCNNCGISIECKLDNFDSISAYEASIFCNKFHLEETGWRDCSFCNKPIHSGCIVSRYLFDYLDFGGIGCISCIKASRLLLNTKEPDGAVTSTTTNASDCTPRQMDGKLLVDSVGEGKLMQLCRIVEASETNGWHQPQRDKMISSSGLKSQEIKCLTRDVDSRFSNMIKTSIHSLKFPLENTRPTWEIKNIRESPAQPSLSMSLGIPSGNSAPASAGEIVEERLEGKPSSVFHQGQRSHPVFAKPSKTGLAMNIETSKGMNSQACVARPSVEGRGKSQLLPRYWPRITDEELEQLSGNLKSTVVPLFEKVLSASDAGRIGRLVLPKACAEAFFPPISQSEGLPLEMQDVKGNEWTFQFRFWPNNNSRMYVLEGVTPCIQSMQLIAGDTVTFSRIDPGGRFIMGFRKTSNSLETQDASTSTHSNGITTKEIVSSGANENLPSGSSYSDLLQSMEGNREPHLNRQSEHLHLGRRVADFPQTENYGQMTKNDSLQQSISVSEKKRTRNIGPKSKRLLINCEDALELKLTWEEAQDLLRPPPSVQPIIVTIEDHIFEEYNEPPVFGKRTIFIACPSGGQEQWASCDDCSKWRKLPVDVLLPPKWTCSENVWDPTRSSCSAPEELRPKELEDLLKSSEGLDALANMAVLGDSLGDPSGSSAGPTTKHPRHRPGCTCIVCIQPPSGKGRHHSTCTCNVCMTVKRRFKTLMLRKKKRQSEREADASQMDHREESDMNGAPKEDASHAEKEGSINRGQLEVCESSSVQIDLNSHPDREDMQVDAPSMNGHVEGPSYPVQQVYVDQNVPNGGQGYFSNGGSFGPIVWENETREDKAFYDPNSSQNSPP